MVEDIGVTRKRLDTESELWTTPFAEFEFDWSDCDVLRANGAAYRVPIPMVPMVPIVSIGISWIAFRRVSRGSAQADFPYRCSGINNEAFQSFGIAGGVLPYFHAWVPHHNVLS